MRDRGEQITVNLSYSHERREKEEKRVTGREGEKWRKPFFLLLASLMRGSEASFGDGNTLFEG